MAAVDGYSECVDALLIAGANVTTQNKKKITALNVISRKTPSSLNVITTQFDEAMSVLQYHDNSNQEVELRLDFRNITQNCFPKESGYLKCLVDEGKKNFLKHPLCQAFLYLKWQKVRKFHFARVAFSLLKVFFLTLFVLTVFVSQEPSKSVKNPNMNETSLNATTISNDLNSSQSKNDSDTLKNIPNIPQGMNDSDVNKTTCNEIDFRCSTLGVFLRESESMFEVTWWILLVFMVIEIYLKFYGAIGFSSVRDYFRGNQNIYELVEIAGALTILIVGRSLDPEDYSWRNTFGSFIIILGWYNLMIIAGELPEFGAHVEMFNKIKGEFLKLFAAFIFILIGFNFAFCIIFTNKEQFSDPFIGFISILVLMIGEHDVTLTRGLDNPSNVFLERFPQILYAIFLFFITIVLMNLLVGIAVNDIQALKKTAELSRLVRQTNLIYRIETVMITEWFTIFPTIYSNWMRKIFRRTTLISPQQYRQAVSVRPLNPSEVRLPRKIMMEAYSIVKSRMKTITKKNLQHCESEDNTAESHYEEYSETTSIRRKFEEQNEKINEFSCQLQEIKALLETLVANKPKPSK